MPPVSYGAGVVRLLLVVAPTAWAAVLLSRRLTPGWVAPLRVLTGIILSLSEVVVVAELLGTVGLFEPVPLTVVLWLVAAAVQVLTRQPGRFLHRRPKSQDDRGTSDVPSRTDVRDRTTVPSRTAVRKGRQERVSQRLLRLGSVDVGAASAAIGLVVAMWATWVANAARFGIGDSDSNWYHLPFAATFARTGWTIKPVFVNAEALVTYYPATGSVLHAVGIESFGSDFLSLVINMVLMPVALLAGWCIGDAADLGTVSLAGVAVALTAPIVVVSQAATANDDLLSIVGLLAAVALVVHPDVARGKGAPLVSGLGAGLAIGTKLTMVVPVLALAVCLAVVTPRTRRRSVMLAWAAGAIVTGCYWYVRDLVIVGNPIPSLNIGIGSIRLPHPPTPSVQHFGSTLAQHLVNLNLWREIFVPGFEQALGSLWWVIVLAALAGVILAATTRHLPAVVGAVVGFAALLAYTITPGGVYGANTLTHPGTADVVARLFSYNVRYLLPFLILGLALLPLGLAARRSGRTIVLLVLGIVVVTNQLVGAGLSGWAYGHGLVGIVSGLTALIIAYMVLARGRAIPGLRPHAPRHRLSRPAANRRTRWAVSCTGAAVLVALLAWPLQDRYQAHRDTASPLAHWADTVEPSSIGYAGFDESYVLYGRSAKNDVMYVGVRGPHGSWAPVGSCRLWRRIVHDGHFEYVVVPIGAPPAVLGYDLSQWRLGLPGGVPPNEPLASLWTGSDPGAHLILSAEGAGVYSITGPATAKNCPAT